MKNKKKKAVGDYTEEIFEKRIKNFQQDLYYERRLMTHDIQFLKRNVSYDEFRKGILQNKWAGLGEYLKVKGEGVSKKRNTHLSGEMRSMLRYV